MKRLGREALPISRLRLPSNFQQRLADAHIDERAQSIVRTGPIYDPIVRHPDYRVLDGLDRVAAHIHLERKEIFVELVECTEAEAEAIQAEANLQRRHGVVKERKALARLVEVYTKEESERVGLPAGKGRPKHARNRAIERVAKMQDVDPSVVRNRLAPPEKKQSKKKKVYDTDGFDLLGMLVTDEFAAQVGKMTRHIDLAIEHARNASKSLSELAGSRLPFPEGRLQRLRTDAGDLLGSLKSARPVSLCLACKGLAKLQPGCVACGKYGVLCANQIDSLPTELADPEARLVLVGGALRNMDDYLEKEPAAAREPVIEMTEQSPWYS